ncbi:uncharacterized protein LOC107368619 isoform X2 [Tetranychus urticae]|uniref:uncharacterized protein LOC107368619 isoform X2 n=1 Tax=Tetranychus urticae TaxID=32264 RepID=UPI00077BA56D|nr:uncharacterized protein LOC107368619 isoform X2 [Tetranychus urticae]
MLIFRSVFSFQVILLQLLYFLCSVNSSVAWTLNEICNKRYSGSQVEENVFKPVMAIEGSTVTFKCPEACKTSDTQRDVWRFTPAYSAVVKSFDVNKGRFSLNRFLELTISNVAISDSGIYHCFTLNHTDSYVLTVVHKEPTNVKVVMKRVNDTRPERLLGRRMSVYNQRQSWSGCNRCGKIGVRSRYDFCTIFVKPLEELPISYLFQNVSPQCRSFIVPKSLQKIVAHRKSDLYYSLCKLSCSEAQTVLIKDSNGSVVDVVDRSKDLYSFHEPLKIETIDQKAVARTEGQSIIMACPGRTADQRVVWFNGSYPLSPIKVHRKTAGRVKIDFAQKLHIRKLLPQDTQIYSCKEHNKVVGIVHLIVISEKLSPILAKFFSYLGGYIIVTSMILIAISIYKNRKSK